MNNPINIEQLLSNHIDKFSKSKVNEALGAESFFLLYNLKNIQIKLKELEKNPNNYILNCFTLIEIEDYLYNTIAPLTKLVIKKDHTLQDHIIVDKSIFQKNSFEHAGLLKSISETMLIFNLIALWLMNNNEKKFNKFNKKEKFNIKFYRNTQQHSVLTLYSYFFKKNKNTNKTDLCLDKYKEFTTKVMKKKEINAICKKTINNESNQLIIKKYKTIINLLYKSYKLEIKKI